MCDFASFADRREISSLARLNRRGEPLSDVNDQATGQNLSGKHCATIIVALDWSRAGIDGGKDNRA